ncbi:MAG: hypothetical protein RIR61_1028 [Bacteroidota bacterium]|jgi:thiol-disulfide isomerase/thioredoxin
MKKTLLFLATAATMGAYAQNPLLVEHFNDTTNALLTNMGWYAHSGGTTNAVAVVSSGLSWTQTAYPGSGVGNAAGVVNTGQDVNKPLASNVDTGSVYTSFLMKANGTVVNGYFFHYAEYSNITTPNYTSITTAFRARTFVLPGTNPATQFKIGLTFNNSSVTADTTANLTIGTTYLVVVKYKFVPGALNDEVSLWVLEDGDNITALPTAPTIGPLTGTAADLTAVQAIALRQYAAGQNVIVDGIIADTTFGFAPAPVTHNVTFQVDMNQVTAGFTTPEVNGFWNNWCGNCNAMTDANGDGIWEVTLPLLEGSTQEYKFSADAWTIQEMNDPTAPCTNGNATYTNRVLVVPAADTTLPVVCWSSCFGCAVDVTLKVNMAWEVANNAISADGIHVAGDFQGWNPGATEMLDADNDGIYEVTINVPANSSIQYKFINGNAWGTDEAVPAACQIAGSANRGATFAYGDSTLAPVCYGKCTDCMASLDETLQNVSLFPNPTRGQFNLARMDAASEVAVSVLDLQGKVLTVATWNAGAESLSIDLGNFANGVYMVRLTSEEGSRTLRVSKN